MRYKGAKTLQLREWRREPTRWWRQHVYIELWTDEILEVFLCFFLLIFVHAFLILTKEKTTHWTFSLNPHFVLRLCKHWHWTLGVISCVWEGLCSEICRLLCSLQADISAHVSYHAEAQGSVVVGEPVSAVAHVPDGRGSWHGGESAHLCAPASAAMREWKRCLTRYTRTGAVHINKKLTQRKCYAPIVLFILMTYVALSAGLVIEVFTWSVPDAIMMKDQVYFQPCL